MCQFFKSSVNKIIGHINETIIQVNVAIQSEYLESINVTTTWAYKDKQTLSEYDSKF